MKSQTPKLSHHTLWFRDSTFSCLPLPFAWMYPVCHAWRERSINYMWWCTSSRGPLRENSKSVKERWYSLMPLPSTWTPNNFLAIMWYHCYTRLNSSEVFEPLAICSSSEWRAAIFLRSAASSSPASQIDAAACLPERVAPSMLSI